MHSLKKFLLIVPAFALSLYVFGSPVFAQGGSDDVPPSPTSTATTSTETDTTHSEPSTSVKPTTSTKGKHISTAKVEVGETQMHSEVESSTDTDKPINVAISQAFQKTHGK